MNTWAYLGITFSFMVIAPLVAAWISSVCKSIYRTPDTGNHLRNGDNLNILSEAVVTPNGDQIGEVVVNIEDHDDEESGV